MVVGWKGCHGMASCAKHQGSGQMCEERESKGNSAEKMERKL